jgi:hypothetical protein
MTTRQLTKLANPIHRTNGVYYLNMHFGSFMDETRAVEALGWRFRSGAGAFSSTTTFSTRTRETFIRAFKLGFPATRAAALSAGLNKEVAAIDARNKRLQEKRDKIFNQAMLKLSAEERDEVESRFGMQLSLLSRNDIQLTPLTHTPPAWTES